MDENATTESEDNLELDAEDSTTEDQDLQDDSTENGNGDDADDSETSESDDESEDDDESETEDADDESGEDTSEFDEDLDAWAEKTHRAIPESDADRKILQELRNSQREYSRTQEAKKSADKVKEAVDANKPEEPKPTKKADPLEARLDRMEAERREETNTRLRSEFFSSSDVSDEEATAMGEILTEKLAEAKSATEKQAEYSYWTNPKHLKDWHALAKARVATAPDTAQIEAEAARKTREKIAKESKANGSSRSASNTRTSEKTEDQARLERFKNW